jgi:hypothetical protein
LDALVSVKQEDWHTNGCAMFRPVLDVNDCPEGTCKQKFIDTCFPIRRCETSVHRFVREGTGSSGYGVVCRCHQFRGIDNRKDATGAEAQSEEAKARNDKRNLAFKDLKRLCADRKPGKPISTDLLASIVSNSHDIGVTQVKQEGKEISGAWEKHGLILAPAHFYVPLPKHQDIQRTNCSAPSKLSGVDMNDAVQKRILNDVLLQHRANFVKSMLPTFRTSATYEFQWENCCFGGSEAQLYWSMIVHHRPKKILEIGAGWSTKLAANAVRFLSSLGDGLQIPVLEAVDPYATGYFDGSVKIRNEMQDLGEAFPGFSHLVKVRVQDVDLHLFDALVENDILFIDSTHCVFFGSDVIHLILEVLPRIARGVLVHFHDIFIPFPYSCSHLRDRTFWNEQYLLQAFLTHNDQWEVMWAETYMEAYHPHEHGKMKPQEEGFSGYSGKSSFWIRRK